MNVPTDRAVRRGALAIAITLVLIVATTTTAIVFPAGREWVRQRLRWVPPTFDVGRASDLPPALYEHADFTVLIFATTHCAACQRALPFHRELSQVANSDARLRAHVLLTSAGDDASTTAETLGIAADRVTMFDPKGTKLHHVPTILVVDRRGIVRAMKEGVLSAEEQHALMEQIRNLR